jgi:predicted acylesterase/phospholipase RssA
MKTASSQINLAKEILAGKIVPSQETYDLAEELWKEGVYSYAGRLYAHLRKSQTAEVELADVLGDADVRVKLALRHSSCTYEDPDLPVDSRFEAALKILEEIDSLQVSTDPAVLSVAGDIYVRKWENDNQKITLERAYCYYDQAYRSEGDQSLQSLKASGYAGIQASFLLDRLAQLELEQAVQVDPKIASTNTVRGRREEARNIRRTLIERFTPIANQPGVELRGWAFYTAVAEAHFGLEEYQEARSWLMRAAELPDTPDRKYEIVARRLIALYRIKLCSASFGDFAQSEGGKVLSEFLARRIKLSTAACESLFSGKVGLALSGSGFRACFFHVGVLAKLAELGVLRKVEVLSCSSGGSIVGTHYYLELRRLLQNKPDAEIQDADYVEVVKRVEQVLLAGVQRNIQLRSKANPWVNLKVLFGKNYSRTDRIGELLEREIFRRDAGNQNECPRYLRELFVHPKGELDSFKPKKDNWRRAAKVPILVLNATTLNTGHNWQFTASWMGEPAGPINSEIDRNLRLRQVRFDEAAEGYQNFSIGKAVIASACEPGLLEPITLDQLYPKMTVRLIDGSISEPLAITPLLDQGCNFLLVSDASGNTDIEDIPRIDHLTVATRSDRISTSHLRKARFEFLTVRQQSSMLQDMVFVHLKKDLEGGALSAIGAPDLLNENGSRQSSEPLTSYGIRKEVQELLAKVRPKLDTFSDTEAYALMTSGYLIAESEFNRAGNSTHQAKDRPDWCFLAIEEQMKKVGDSDILRLLAVAQNRIVRVWKLSKFLQNSTVVSVLGLVLLGVYLYRTYKDVPIDSDLVLVLFIILIYLIAFIILILIFLGVPLLLLVMILRLTRRDRSSGQIIRSLSTFLIGWLGSWIQILLFDKWYMALGNINRPQAEVAESSGRLTGAIHSTVAKLDKEGRAQTETLNKTLDRFETVEAVSKLFEASGYEVARFPRDRELNPFQLNLDLFASKGNHKLFADIKTGSDSVDWKDASGLKMAASFLKKPDGVAEPAQISAMLFLIDVPANESLQKYSEKEGVKVIRMGSDGLKRILDCRGNTTELKNEAQRLNLFSEEPMSSEMR